MQKERGHLDILSTVWVSALNSYHCYQCFDPGCWLGDKKGNRCFFCAFLIYSQLQERETAKTHKIGCTNGPKWDGYSV